MAAIKAEGEDEFLSFVLYCIWWIQHLLVDLSPALQLLCSGFIYVFEAQT